MLAQKRYVIRQAMHNDDEKIGKIIETAFANEPHSDHQEQHLVNRLRLTPSFVPELSLVAEVNQQQVGYILLTQVDIEKTNRKGLALAPLAVLPEYQRKGIGAALVERAHSVAKQLGFSFVVVLGHPDYYPRLGYRPMTEFNLILPFDVPKDYCFVSELVPYALKSVSGTVIYSSAFFE